MNRNQRRFAKTPRKNDSKLWVSKSKHGSEIEEVFPPKGRRGYIKVDKGKSMTNRCCYVSPEQQDFGQLTDAEPSEQYQNVLLEQYGFDPIPETITQLKELKKVLCGESCKVENSSQYINDDCAVCLPAYVATCDGSQWQNVDNTDEIDKFLMREEKATRVNYERLPKNVQISDVPRVKIIAEKFSKFKKENLELRRLDEKVVCVEYDIFDESSSGALLKPIQQMRAFFSVKPVILDGSNNEVATITELPCGIKNKFHITDDDLKKLTEKEIEIIDSKIEENRTYLDDLRRILKRKKIIDAKKNKQSLDLLSLYEMAKMERPPLDCDYSNANLLSKAELQDVKDLILAKCKSSVHVISRKRLKCENEIEPTRDVGVLSESIVAVLLREEDYNVFK